jgi:hypothetical protein
VKCSITEIDGRFIGAYSLHHQGDDCPDRGGKYLRNVGQLYETVRLIFCMTVIFMFAT